MVDLQVLTQGPGTASTQAPLATTYALQEQRHGH